MYRGKELIFGNDYSEACPAILCLFILDHLASVCNGWKEDISV